MTVRSGNSPNLMKISFWLQVYRHSPNLVFATLFGAVKALFENRILAAGLPSSAAKSPIKTFSTTPPESNPAHGPSKSAPRDPQGRAPGPPREPPGTTRHLPEHPCRRPWGPQGRPRTLQRHSRGALNRSRMPRRVPRACQMQHKRLQSLKVP